MSNFLDPNGLQLDTMTAVNNPTEENANLVGDYLNRAWNGDGVLDEDVVSDDYIVHLDRPENTFTFNEMQRAVDKSHEAFPDLQFEITNTVATDAMVAVQYQWSGTHEAEILGVEPTGTAVDVTGLAQFHIEDGQLTEAWYVEDVAGVREELEAAAQ